MADLPSAANIKEIVSLFAPGMILLWARSRVQAGSTPDFQERLISYAIASTGYFAAVSPLFYVPSGVQLSPWFWAILHYALVPAGIGWALAYASQREWEYRAAELVGLQFSHHIPAAWDFKFSRMQGSTYILATLKDGSQVGGLFGTQSFASSSKDERDLLIEDVWTVNKENEWSQATPPRSALLCGSDIHYIEIFKGDSA
jgi:Family of unknown function (DUF6338)